MDYIVLDLEWNQSPNGKKGEHPRMPFEIIEIGAVKVDEHMGIVDRYSALIKPKLYRKLQRQIKEMLSYDEKDLAEKGRIFPDVCKEFLAWCGEDYAFCTWGPSDLYILQENMAFYNMKKLPFPLKFYNVQQIFADEFIEDKVVCKLEKAVNDMNIPEDIPYHAAINDAIYTAKVMATKKFPKLKDKFTIDTFRHPVKKDEEIVSYHDGYLEQISGEYRSKQEAMEDKDITTILCCKCGRKCTKKIRWFQSSQHTELAVGKCWKHGYMQGRIRFKSAGGSDDNIFVIKKVTKISKNGLVEVRIKQEMLREKRREKRNSKEASS